MDQVRMAQSPHARSEAHSGKGSRALRNFRVLALDHHLLFNFYPAPWLFSLSRYIPASVRVVERFVDLPLTHRWCKSTESFLATATTARFFEFLAPREAIFSPWRLRSESEPKGPRMY